MQDIILYATANEVLARVRDRVNAKAALAPTLARGCGFRLRIRLFANSYDDTPYPASRLDNITSWAFVMDSDWDSGTPFKLVADAGKITVDEVQEAYDGEMLRYTEAVVPVSQTNTEELTTWLGTSEGKDGLNAELIGYDKTGEEAFVLQIKGFSVRNRLGSVGEPTVIPSEYLNADQVRALIAAGAVLQFSPDGNAWKDSQEEGDVYMRFRSASDASAAWSPAIALPQGAPGTDGKNAYLYVRYASDAEGTGFSPAPSSALPFIGILVTDTELTSVDAAAFTGKWVRYQGEKGEPGEDGKSAYTYVAYASDNTGASFSLTPTSGLKYRAELHSDAPLASPNAADFADAVWVKYIGDDGTGAGDMLKAVYDTDDDGVVDAAKRLVDKRKIGAADFDGTADITLSDMGAQPALPTAGTEGQFLQKTANGVKWAAVAATGASGAAWGQITGRLQDQSDLNTALAGKISSPSGGSTGQYLQKTATGVQWATVQGGGGSSTPDISSLKAVRTISSEDAFEALAQEVKDSLKEIAFLATPGTADPLNWSAQDGYVRPGHAYLLLPFQWKYSYEVRWKHFVVTGRYWKCTLKGGICKVDGVQKTLRPGEGTEAYSTDTYGTSWNATKPAETTILRLALDLKILYISDTEKIQLNTNGTLDSDGNLIVKGDHMEIVDGLWKYTGKAVTELAYDYDIDYHTSGHWEDSSTVTVDIRDYFLFDLTANATYYAMPTSTKSAALEIAPGGRYAWALDADSTLNAAAVPEGHWAAAQIDIAPGAHKVTAGSNLAIVDTLTANAVNVCEARWRNGAARLKVVDVITGGGGGDTPQPTPTITAPSSQSVEGTQGEELTASIATGVSASNDASVSYAVKQGSALPAGLALSATGDVTGTPTAAGSTTTTVVLSAEGCDSVEMSVSFAISEAATGGTETRTAKAFGHPGTTVANMYKAALQTYTYAGTFQVGGETFPYFTGGGTTPWYLFGGKARLDGTSATAYAVYLSSQNPSTMDFNEWQITFCRVDLDSSARLILLGETGKGLTYADVSGKLPASMLSSSAWWRTADSDYNGTQGSDTMVWEDGGADAGDAFPQSFNVKSVPVASGYAQKPIGSYARTGDTLELGGVAYPVYSHTSDAVTGDMRTFYIHICNQLMGNTGVYWALSYEKPTSAAVEGYVHPRLACVELKSDTYEPQGKNWGGADGTSEVEWTM